MKVINTTLLRLLLSTLGQGLVLASRISPSVEGDLNERIVAATGISPDDLAILCTSCPARISRSAEAWRSAFTYRLGAVERAASTRGRNGKPSPRFSKGECNAYLANSGYA